MDGVDKFGKTVDDFGKTVDDFGKTDKLKDAFDKNNITELEKYEHIPNFYCNIFVDTALEEGNSDMTKLLVNNFKCRPSLYAKQMAHVNGHHKLAFWTETYGQQRNDTDIKTVHYNHKTKTWNNSIPEEFRY